MGRVNKNREGSAHFLQFCRRAHQQSSFYFNAILFLQSPRLAPEKRPDVPGRASA